jgi:probable HAF family extracellular repeat protein
MRINARQTIRRLPSLTLVVAVGVLALSPLPLFAQQTYTFTQVDAPNSTLTEGRAINDKGEIVGQFDTTSKKGVQSTTAFAYSAKGRLTTFAAKGSTRIQATGVNNSGEIVGMYQDSSNVWHGYTYNGPFRTLDPAGSTLTFVWGVNGNGDVVGSFTNPNTTPSGQGFLYSPPAFELFNDPSTTNFGFTTAFAVNNLGDVAGDYGDGNTLHGFTNVGGTYTTFDPIGSTETHALGINNSDQVAGFYYDASGVTHGFLCHQGACTTIDPPGSVFTTATGINEAGQVVGYYTAPDFSHYHGFVYDPTNSTYSTIDPPGASGSLTLANGINNLGQVVGEFTDAAGVTHAFIATPNP